MVRNEFEVYIIEHAYRFASYLKQCDQCILIIDPHFGLTLKKWGDFIADSLLPLIEGESSIIFFTVKELFSILKEPFPDTWVHDRSEKSEESGNRKYSFSIRAKTRVLFLIICRIYSKISMLAASVGMSVSAPLGRPMLHFSLR